MILGTSAYMSPEQAMGKPVGKRADIWAFGVVLSEMLAGRMMFAGVSLSGDSTPAFASLTTAGPVSYRADPRRWLSRNSITIVHVGVTSVGFVTEQSADAVDRRVAPSRMASFVRKLFHGPWPAFGSLTNTTSRHALFSAM